MQNIITASIDYTKFPTNIDQKSLLYDGKQSILYVKINEKLYNTIKIGDSYSCTFYKNLDNTKQSKEYNVIVYIVKSLNNLKNISIVDVDINGLYHMTFDEIEKLLTQENVRCKFNNIPICNKQTIIIEDIVLTIEIDDDECSEGLITQDTIIEFDFSNKTCNKLVQTIENLKDATIEFKISDNSSFYVSKTNRIHKNNIIKHVFDHLKRNFCLNQSFCICKSVFENLEFSINEINTCSSDTIIDIDNVYTLKNANSSDVYILFDNQSKYLILYDDDIELTENDTVVFSVVTNNIIVDETMLTNNIKKKILKQQYMLNDKITIFVNGKKITVSLTDVTIKNNNSKYSVFNYKFVKIPIVKVNSNVEQNTYVIDYSMHTNQKIIKSVTFRATKTNSYNMNDSLTQLLQLSNNVNIRLENVEEYFKQKIKEDCVFTGRVFNLTFNTNVKLIIENISYEDETSNNNDFLMGKFTESTVILISKVKSDKSINIIDENCQSNGKIKLETIKNLLKELELSGLYGMEQYVNKIITDVLILRTDIVDENVKKIIKPSKGIILHGPPGTGKTSLAKKLSLILGGNNCKLKMLTSTELMSKWHGESEKNVRNLFDDAIKSYTEFGNNAPIHFIIIDEIDALLANRSGSETNAIRDSIVNQFLGVMDGFIECLNVIVIGITNKIHLLDNACLRPGRFGCKILINLPTDDQRLNIIKNYHQKLLNANISNEIDYNLLRDRTRGMSGADIESIFNSCTGNYISNKLNGNTAKISTEDVLNCINV